MRRDDDHLGFRLPMSTLLDAFSSAFHGDAARRAVLDEVLRDGLPGPRTEAWKYTSLRDSACE